MLASSNAGRLLGQAHTVFTLLFEYTPALFLIGHPVRECGWSACSREVAHKVLRYSYVTMTHVLHEFRYNVEYLRTLGTTLLVWDKWYDNLPGRCHAEESCEALLARLVAAMRANPQCKSFDTACDLFLVLKAACSDEKNLHDSRIQRGFHEYVDGNIHKVVGRVLTDAVPAVIWDRNKTVTSSVEWPADFAYPRALSTPLPCAVHTNMLTRTLYTLTGPVKLSEESVSYFNTPFFKYPPDRAHLRARVMEVFRKSVAAEVLPQGKQPALAQSQNRPQQPSGGGNGPLPPFRPGALNPVRAAVLSDADSDADTYVGDDVLPVDVGLDLSVHSSDLTEVGNYVMLEEKRSMVGSSVLSSQLR